jgi:oxygen-independent coproporphyrinogen-3 oxidase
MVATMQALGYRRLHIGVQSLDEPVRQEIRRRRPVAEVLQKIEETLAMGWVVSVDMVCGLPYQTINSLVADIETLLALGVNGVSLYELLIYPQNQRWADAHGLTKRGHVGNYFMFQAGASVLQQRGLRQNLFNHWADSTDQNVYFTYPTRGEDCLAVGTIADGVLGDYHFRHPRYGAYNRELAQGWPGLQGGLRRTAEETALLPWLTTILSGHINPPLAPIFRSWPVYGTDLLSFWQEQKLIESASGEGAFRLTANGAWFAGNMVRQVMALGQGIAGKN